MAWTYVGRGGGPGSQVNQASISGINLPTGWAPGDLHILQFQNFGGTNARTPDTPSGWTAIPSGGLVTNGTTYHGLWYRVAQSGDTSLTLTLSGSGAANDTQLPLIFGFRCDAGYVPTLDATGANSTNASADNVGPISGLTNVANALLILSGGKSNDWNGTATQVSFDALAFQNEDTGGSDAGCALFYTLAQAAGTVTAKTITDNGGTASNGLGTGIMVSFKEVLAKSRSFGCIV